MSIEETKSRGGFFSGAMLGLLFGLILFTFYRTAWLGDDSYITFRTVDNFVNGYGLRWNVAERVQSYTNPLWMLLLSALYFITREMYLTPLLFSYLISAVVVGFMLFVLPRTKSVAIFAAVAMLFSRAFVDYSSSGLENPLTHLLVVLFVYLFFQSAPSFKSLLLCAFVGGLLPVNRVDTILLVGPALLYLLASNLSLRGVLLAGAALGPIAAWEIFSVIYYGFPFPNTAYAKLGAGVGGVEFALQGLNYYKSCLTRDPVTLPVIALGLVVAVWSREAKRMLLALGVVLYLLYIVKVGGDFMMGRFFSAPFVVALALIVTAPRRERYVVWAPLALAAAAASLLVPFPPPLTGAEFGKLAEGGGHWKDQWDVADERRYYFDETGLIHYRPDYRMPNHPHVRAARNFASKKDLVRVHDMIGFRGMYAGPRIHIVDRFALADPLLARLPGFYVQKWRIGHFRRVVPEGYVETIKTGRNVIEDKKLAEYYDKLRLIVAGPLFSPVRWKAIVAMNLGEYDHLIDQEKYRYPKVKQMTLQHASTRMSKPNARPLPLEPDGLRVTMAEALKSKRVEFTADANDAYKVILFKDGEQVAEKEFGPAMKKKRGLRVIKMVVPEAVTREGFDRIHIFPLRGDKIYSVGYVKVS